MGFILAFFMMAFYSIYTTYVYRLKKNSKMFMSKNFKNHRIQGAEILMCNLLTKREITYRNGLFEGTRNYWAYLLYKILAIVILKQLLYSCKKKYNHFVKYFNGNFSITPIFHLFLMGKVFDIVDNTVKLCV